MANQLADLVGRFGVNPKEARRFAKFLVVGTLGFIVDFGMLTALVEIVDLPGLVAANTQFSAKTGLIVANTISFTLAVVSNFTFNRYWTYPESRSRRKRVQLPQFTVVSVIGLALNNGILALTVGPFSSLLEMLAFVPSAVGGYVPAKVLATGVVLFWNFFINRFWTFGNVP
jgi:putative flippase GtrA